MGLFIALLNVMLCLAVSISSCFFSSLRIFLLEFVVCSI